MFTCEPFLLLFMIVLYYALSCFFNTIVFYCFFCVNAALIIVPKDSITRCWTVQRTGGYILRAEPSEFHLETLHLRVSYLGVQHTKHKTITDIYLKTHNSKFLISCSNLNIQY